ncbi:uncharacterized protein [Cherax quadricarinatus]|uniref:uncharacterized protein n=1 Tax=Cherax quadricarinatus TaxID=27406 RepID=UPI00387E7038
MSSNERVRGSQAPGYLAAEDLAVRLDSGGASASLTLQASSSSVESHDDMAAAVYHSSESEDDLIEGERQDDPTCPDSALYEFIFRACALMALENDELKQIIEQQQQQADSRREKSEEEEGATSKQETDAGRKKGKKQKVMMLSIFIKFLVMRFIYVITVLGFPEFHPLCTCVCRSVCIVLPCASERAFSHSHFVFTL